MDLNLNQNLFSLFFVALLTQLFACKEQPKEAISEFQISYKNVDHSKVNTIKYSNQIESVFEILYFGAKKGKIEVDGYVLQENITEYIIKTQHFSHPNILYYLSLCPPFPHKDDLMVNIDSSLSYPIVIYQKPINSFMGREIDTILANPLIIENISDRFFNLITSNQVDIIIQAIDTNGEWKDISHPFQRFCGTGIMSLPMFPKEIIITSIPVFEGPFRTKARLKIHEYYSEEFSIQVKEDIFIPRYNDYQ